MQADQQEAFDVLIIGAGLSGIGAAWHLATRLPGKTFAIFEARSTIGGTWDLFRYPGVRSDSDMFTLGYRFRPWSDPKIIADGPAILSYVRETAERHAIDERIRFEHRVRDLSWSRETGRWTVTAETPDGTRTVTARIVWNCAGYYRYAHGYTPDFPGRDQFGGVVVHPQNWPADLDCEGKKVVIIGSGATAVTLAPVLAKKAPSVTMLQRSPTYMFAMPGVSKTAERLASVLPARHVFALMRSCAGGALGFRT